MFALSREGVQAIYVFAAGVVELVFLRRGDVMS
jgi:hypothetical protein